MSESDLHLLTGVYATGALDDEEHEAFVAHLATCANCRDEVAELTATAAVLGVAAAEPIPPGFRERVFAEVASTRQLPPVVSSLSEARDRDQDRKGSSRARRAVMSAAAAAVVLTVGLGAWGLSLNEENSHLRNEREQILSLQTAADARTVHAVSGSATAALTMSRSHNGMVFIAHGLRDVGSDRTYQIWLLGPGSSVRSMGTFSSDGKSNTTRLMQEFPAEAVAVAVTEEPAGGSPRPTNKPVLALDLPRGA